MVASSASACGQLRLAPPLPLRLRLRLQLADRGFVWAQAWAATEEVTLVIEACGSRCNLPDVPAGGSTFQRVADGGIGSHVVLCPTFVIPGRRRC